MKRSILFLFCALCSICIVLSLFAAESYIQLPPDSTGKKERTITQSISGNTVHLPAQVISDPTGTYNANVTSSGALKVDGSAVTQPISGTVSVGTPTVNVASMPTTPISIHADRTNVIFYATAAAAGATTTETAITLTKATNTGATSAADSFVVPSGKYFHITAFSVATRGHATATAQSTKFNLRVNLVSAVTTTSTPVILSVRSATPATASAWDRVLIPVPEGYDILGDGTLQFGITAAATYTTNAPTWDVTIIGYEY